MFPGTVFPRIALDDHCPLFLIILELELSILLASLVPVPEHANQGGAHDLFPHGLFAVVSPIVAELLPGHSILLDELEVELPEFPVLEHGLLPLLGKAERPQVHLGQHLHEGIRAIVVLRVEERVQYSLYDVHGHQLVAGVLQAVLDQPFLGLGEGVGVLVHGLALQYAPNVLVVYLAADLQHNILDAVHILYDLVGDNGVIGDGGVLCWNAAS